MVRGGDPDAIDSIVPMAYGNLALDLILHGHHGRLVVLKNGRYDNMPIEAVTSTKKTVNVERYYNRSACVHSTPISKCSRYSSWRVIRKGSAGRL